MAKKKIVATEQVVIDEENNLKIFIREKNTRIIGLHGKDILEIETGLVYCEVIYENANPSKYHYKEVE